MLQSNSLCSQAINIVFPASYSRILYQFDKKNEKEKKMKGLHIFDVTVSAAGEVYRVRFLFANRTTIDINGREEG